MTASTPIDRVLVANRGEIARRVIHTCRRLGIETVAVYSDADAASRHVDEADCAVRLPDSAPADTYLRADLLLDAGRATGADAVHPGYGFLSENAGFARAVLEAGLTWIGPPPEAIAAMGSKVAAKRLMAAAGVPVLAEIDPATADADDLPVLIKAVAGGGGRGMHVVTGLDGLAAALTTARREAESAFGDPAVFCERYLPTGRHIEVQIFADAHGTVWTIGERECSIQRHHQKVIEETPSPLVDRVPGMRGRLFDAAGAACRAVDYRGAGTVEFIADESGRFYFLEMNTRLQVEHPVTECTTGLDLVELQLAVARGEPLAEKPPTPQGHSIEARLYAEDPRRGWQPRTGRLYCLEVPGVQVRFDTPATLSGLRLDAGVSAGDEIGVHYDALLAKVVSWAPSRAHAARLLAGALDRARIHGVGTNRDVLVNVLRHKAFLAGDTDTAFFDTHGLDALATPHADTAARSLSALAAALAIDADDRAGAAILPGVPSAWRNVISQSRTVEFDSDDGPQTVHYRIGRDGLADETGAQLVTATADRVVLIADGVRRTFRVSRYPDDVEVDSTLGPVRLTLRPRFPDPGPQTAPGALVAALPGVVARLAVSVGDRVRAGEPLLWLEAMKMQHRLDAAADGIVEQLCVAVGQQVESGEVLAVITSTTNEEDTT